MIKVWRIVKAAYANTAFDGEGARVAGGRWNHVGTSIVYTTESLALAALERFVALDKVEHTMKLVSISATIPKNIDIQFLTKPPLDWNHYPASVTTQEYGSNWISSNTTAVLKVPSVIILSEFNFLFNPSHPEFKKIKINEVNPFSFDPRMWKNR